MTFGIGLIRGRGPGFWSILAFLCLILGAIAAVLFGPTAPPKTAHSIGAKPPVVLLINPNANALKGRMDTSNLVPIFRTREDAARWVASAASGKDEETQLFLDGKMTFVESGSSALLIELNEGKSPLDRISQVELLRPYKSKQIEWKRTWTFNALISVAR